jgi:hypothetical protein
VKENHMIDLKTETLIDLKTCKAWANHFRGRTFTYRQLHGWWRYGLRINEGDRVFLETARFGNRRVTSVEAMERFLARLNKEPAERKPARRRKGRGTRGKVGG